MFEVTKLSKQTQQGRTVIFLTKRKTAKFIYPNVTGLPGNKLLRLHILLSVLHSDFHSVLRQPVSFEVPIGLIHSKLGHEQG